MTTEDICRMPVADISEKDSILLLWCTWPKLTEGIEVMKAWGFKQVSGFPWVKMQAQGMPRIGMGYYTRSVSEIVIVGTRGKGLSPAPSTRKNGIITEPEIVFSPIGKHSRKPDMQYEFAEVYGGPYIEIFGRPAGEDLMGEREGWVRIGTEITGRDIFEDLEILKNQ
jgi:site-specific DNA-methyltransferase (adenine-specific)